MPAAHQDGAYGEDRISADIVLGDPANEEGETVTAPLSVEQAPEPPMAENDDGPSPQTTPSTGLGGLFGWGNRNADIVENVDTGEAPKADIVEAVDENPEPAPFDDADLEIPAFLRRSANH